MHLTNAALGLNSKGSAAVIVKVDGKEFVIARLVADKVEHTNLDLYFRDDQKVTFKVDGTAEVHLSGYFEPEHDDDDFGDYAGFDEEDEDDEEEEEIEDEDDEEEEVEK